MCAMFVALAHARRYAHFESTIPNSSPIQPHESDLMVASLKYDDQAAWKHIPKTITSLTSYFQIVDSDSSAWGKAVATIDASHTHFFSYLWNQHSYQHTNRHVEREGPDALSKVVFVPDSHTHWHSRPCLTTSCSTVPPPRLRTRSTPTPPPPQLSAAR